MSANWSYPSYGILAAPDIVKPGSVHMVKPASVHIKPASVHVKPASVHRSVAIKGVCKAVLTSGPRAGHHCGKPLGKRSKVYCSRHTKRHLTKNACKSVNKKNPMTHKKWRKGQMKRKALYEKYCASL